MLKTMFTKFTASLLAAAIVLSGCAQSPKAKTVTTADANAKYIEKIDLNYSYNLAKKLEEFKSNEKLGYRTAGSKAEVATGEMLFEEMKSLGLTQVAKDEFTLDTWEFEKAELSFKGTDGTAHTAIMGGYQTNFDTAGPKEYQVVYGGRGTAADLAELDVTGKLVLVDINQSEEWWITYPAYQAKVKGAAGVIAMQVAGFSEVSPDALNANDICGPADAPAFSISQTDAGKLKEALKASNNLMSVTLDAKSTVGFDGKAYNISGRIEGEDKESYILLSAHYDSYFAGFQDDNAAIALMLGIAKGLIDSGYKPQKTIIFNALAAEEWGVSNTRYDWSTGAYNQIFRVHPEWQGKAVADINFELPAYQHREADEIRSVYELKSFLTEFAATVPAPEGVYPEGLKIITPLRTWSDDFSFSLAGVPALRNDFQDSEFSKSHYHTQFDNSDTYNEAAFKYHHILYGMMAIYYDRTCVVPLDFTTNLEAMTTSIDGAAFEAAGQSTTALTEGVTAATTAATELNKMVADINTRYREAIDKGDTKTAQKIYAESRPLNDKLLKAFRHGQDSFNRLTWEDVQKYPHELVTNNLNNLEAALAALREGDGALAVDEYLWQVDNNWYAYDFDRDVYNYFTDYVLNQPADRLMWGAGRIVGHVDLYDTVQSLLASYDVSDADYSTEIAALEKAIASQQALLEELLTKETADLKTLTDMLAK